MNSKVEVQIHAHPKPSEDKVSYGTAGFRMKAEKLDYINFRMGLLASLRSQAKSAVVGVMITASHNPVADNGLKIVDPHGEMLEISWEGYATRIANCSDESLGEELNKIVEETGLSTDRKPQVFIGMDTRPSSGALSKACRDGIEAMGGEVTDYGVVTTPQLHYFVWSHNTKSTHPPTEEGYYRKMANHFIQLTKSKITTPKLVTVDGANGVGAIKCRELQKFVSECLNVDVKFDGSDGILNHQCGADYVKTNQRSPPGLEMNADSGHASLDGDADRIVYYYKSQDGAFHLLDGDKIAVLIASYLKELLNTSGLADIKLGLVQTAYANGASTQYISETLNVPVACAKTGVKHLHHAALDFDIGVYFEANGHGTVIFSESATKAISSSTDPESESGRAALKLLAVSELINQVVGDALADMLLVEAILIDKSMSLSQWGQQYTDLPNNLKKVSVADRQVIQTTDAERRTTSPEGLQAAIDNLVSKVSKGRSFVRPSGTEDVVRVYAEAETTDLVTQLARDVCNLVYDMCNGVGDRPQ